MVLGLSSFAFGWSVGVPGSMPPKPMNEMDLLQTSLHFGMNCLQIGDNLPLHLLSSERLANLKSAIIQNNIRLEVGARKLTQEHLDQYIRIASDFNSPLLRFVIDGNQYEPALKSVAAIIKEALPILKQHKVILGIENHDRFKATELADLMESIGSDQVGICLDCVNSMGAGEGLEWVASTLAPYTVNLHIKDFIIQRLPHQMGFTISGTPLGKGMINLPWLLEKLSQYKRCNSAVLEQWVMPEATIEETIKKEELWAEESVAYLRRVVNSRKDRKSESPKA